MPQIGIFILSLLTNAQRKKKSTFLSIFSPVKSAASGSELKEMVGRLRQFFMQSNCDHIEI